MRIIVLRFQQMPSGLDAFNIPRKLFTAVESSLGQTRPFERDTEKFSSKVLCGQWVSRACTQVGEAHVKICKPIGEADDATQAAWPKPPFFIIIIHDLGFICY